jgi:HAD superfamily hydrolase (TIGR01450 family)
VPGAVDRITRLRARGKRLVVLTNAASYPRAAALAKYRALGFDFAAQEVVSSRDVAAAHLAAIAPGGLWGAIAAAGDDFADIPAQVRHLRDAGDFEAADGFLFLSASGWTPDLGDRLARALDRRPRPLVVANPDLVAPREGGLSVEPGTHARALLDRVAFPCYFFGKPFPAAFTAAAERTGLAPGQLAMVGDTLHTDVLGGAAAGMGTVLVARHGLFAGLDAVAYIRRSGIVPDAVVETT